MTILNDEMRAAVMERMGFSLASVDPWMEDAIEDLLAIAERQWQEQYGDAFRAGWWRGQHELCPRCGVALEREACAAQRFEVVTWDFREQPDMQAIAAALTRLFGDGVHIAWPETGSDQYAVVLSDRPFTAEQAAAAYHAGGAP